MSDWIARISAFLLLIFLSKYLFTSLIFDFQKRVAKMLGLHQAAVEAVYRAPLLKGGKT